MTPSLPTFSMHFADELADGVVVVGGDGRDLRHLLALGDRAWRSRAARSTMSSVRLLDAALEGHRVGAGGDVLQAFGDDRLAEDGGGGGAVTGDVVGLGGDLLGELGADVLERVLELDLLGDGDAVVGDRGGAELLVEDDVAALGAEGDLDGVGQGVNAILHRSSGFLIEEQLLCHSPDLL